MGWLTPKYPKSDTPGATGTPAPRESRADRKSRERHEAIDAAMQQGWQNARRASSERSARFWANDS